MKNIVILASLFVFLGLLVSCNPNNPDSPGNETELILLMKDVLSQPQDSAVKILTDNGFSELDTGGPKSRKIFLKEDSKIAIYIINGNVLLTVLNQEMADMENALKKYRKWTSYAWNTYYPGMDSWSGRISTEAADKEYGEIKGGIITKDGREVYEKDLKSLSIVYGIEEEMRTASSEVDVNLVQLGLNITKTEESKTEIFFKLHDPKFPN